MEGSGCRLVSEHPLDRERITKLVPTIFADDLHAKRVVSLGTRTADHVAAKLRPPR